MAVRLLAGTSLLAPREMRGTGMRISLLDVTSIMRRVYKEIYDVMRTFPKAREVYSIGLLGYVQSRPLATPAMDVSMSTRLTEESTKLIIHGKEGHSPMEAVR